MNTILLFIIADLDHYYNTPQVQDASSLTMLTVESEVFYPEIVPIDLFFLNLIVHLQWTEITQLGRLLGSSYQ